MAATDEDLWQLELLGGARRLVEWQFAQFAALVHGDVIEVGAGVGTFTRLLAAHGAERILAVEPHHAAYDAMRSSFAGDPRITVRDEPLPDGPWVREREASADLVLCQNVLEHIEDDVAAMRAMASTLRPGGHLALLVPAGPRLFGPLDVRFGHVRRYSKELLRQFASSAPLELVSLRSFNLLGVVGWWLQRWRREPRIGGLALRLYTLALLPWRPLEDRLRPPWGLSLVATYRRRAA